MIEIGQVRELVRYPIKSMAGISAPSARLGWHGIEGDLRCRMINFDPDTAENDPRVMKTVTRLNQNQAGVYGTVVRTGQIRVGDSVHLVPETFW